MALFRKDQAETAPVIDLDLTRLPDPARTFEASMRAFAADVSATPYLAVAQYDLADESVFFALARAADGAEMPLVMCFSYEDAAGVCRQIAQAIVDAHLCEGMYEFGPAQLDNVTELHER